MSDRKYIIYDDRAAHGMGTDDASIFTVCDSLSEARTDAKEYGACAVYSYASKGNELTDERFEFNHYPEERRRPGNSNRLRRAKKRTPRR